MSTKTQVACAFGLLGIAITAYICLIAWGLNCHV